MLILKRAEWKKFVQLVKSRKNSIDGTCQKKEIDDLFLKFCLCND